MDSNPPELDRLFRLFSWMEDQASPAWWGSVVSLQGERVGEAQKQLIHAGLQPGEAWDRLRADIFFLFMAIHHVVRYVRHFKELSGDRRLEAAEQRFLEKTPHSKEIRDFLEHLDEYAIGAGRMHQRGQLDSRERSLQISIPDTRKPEGELFVWLGEWLVPVKAAAQAAIDLAGALAEVHRGELDGTMRRLTAKYGVALPADQ